MNKINEKLLNWSYLLAVDTRDLAERVSEMPFIYPHLVLMPDAHVRQGAAVGSVLPTSAATIPAAIGSDVGCGIISVKTNYTYDDMRLAGRPLRELTDSIEQCVPLSEKAHNLDLGEAALRRAVRLETRAVLSGFDPATYSRDWRLQLGTLGSGNHSVDVSVDEAEGVWLSVHSGSRAVGNAISAHHLSVAHDLAQRYATDLPDPELAYLVEGTKEFDAFIAQVHWTQHFAMANREELMDRVVSCFGRWISRRKRTLMPVEQSERINCHHNFIRKERHRGRDVWLHRRGAIDAHDGVMGLVPGALGSVTYVVRGRGNKSALCSSPHGAGWNHNFPRQPQMSGAYLTTGAVIADAADLVDVHHTLRHVLRVKGV